MSRPAEPSRERAWRFWRETLKEPRFVCAPMVLQSELAFRMLVRAHGCQLCYTPMIPASTFLEHGGNEWPASLASPCKLGEHGANTAICRAVTGQGGRRLLRGADEHRRWRVRNPVLHDLPGGSAPHRPNRGPRRGPTAGGANFGAFSHRSRSPPPHSSARSQVARRLEGEVDAIDINLGCPQKCAERGGACNRHEQLRRPRRTPSIARVPAPHGMALPIRASTRAGYGAFLAEDVRKVELIVKTLVANLRVPVTAKARPHRIAAGRAPHACTRHPPAGVCLCDARCCLGSNAALASVRMRRRHRTPRPLRAQM
jgi:hypothetical protein